MRNPLITILFFGRISSVEEQRKTVGFTMPEVIIVILIIGVLAAISAPSFLRWVRNKEVDDALALVVGALREAQSEALRLGQGCKVDIDTSTKVIRAETIQPPPPAPPTPSENCLPTGRRDLRNASSGIQMTTSFGGGNDLIFTYKKTTPADGLIVLFQSDAAKQRCVVVSQGLGLLRTGFYQGDPNATLSITNCQRDP